MSEPFPKPRHDMRHDMVGYDAQDQRTGPSREDPLAELARLVGKDDPFRGNRPPASNVTHFPQPSTPRHAEDDYYPDHEDFRDFDGDHRHHEALASDPNGAQAHRHSHHDEGLHFPPVASEVEAFEPALGYPAAGGQGEAPRLNADLWAEGALPQSGPTGDLFHDQPGPDLAQRGTPRRTLVVLAAVVALTGGGLGATFLMRDGSGMHLGTGGAPPTIMASDTPAKVQSPDATNGNTPDSNTALLEKTGSDKTDNAKVVSNDEQPLDLNQLPKTGSGQGDAAAQSGNASSPFPQPRKVKTVLVRPDGSIVGEGPQAVAAPEQPVGMVLPMAAGGQSQPVAAEPSTPKATARASTTPTSPAGGASGTKPAPSARTTPAKPAVVASAEEDTAPAPAATTGGWSVQLGAPPSEQEAKEMSARLQKKFSADLGGLKPSIVKAERNGKAIYRVRVGSLAQADAKALCTKLQGDGGSCFVVRN